MSAAHMHLILAHIPVVGLFLSTLLLAYAWWRRDTGARKIALAGLTFSGLMALPVFFTGEGAEEAVEKLAGISKTLIERHEVAARIAAVLSALVGAGAALSWFWEWRRGSSPRALRGAVALSALVAFGAIGWTANLGGQINHPEIAGNAAFAAEPESQQGEEEGGDADDDDDASIKDFPRPPNTSNPSIAARN